MLKSVNIWGIVALLLAAAVAALALLWPSPPRDPPPPREAVLERLAPLPPPQARALPAAAASPAEDGQWTMPLGDYAATRFSALDRIDAGNVSELRPVFTFDTGIAKGHEAAPRLTTSQQATPCAAATGRGRNTHFSGSSGRVRSSA